MREELQGGRGLPRHIDCPSCGQSMSVELCLGFNENGDLYVQHEGLCTHCLSSMSTPLPELLLVMDESSSQIIAN